MNNSPFEPEAFEFDFEDRRSGRIRPSFPPRPPAPTRSQFRGRSAPPTRSQFQSRPTQSSRAPSQGRFQRGTSSRFGSQFPRQGSSSRQHSRFPTWPRLRPFMQTTMMSSAFTGGGADSDMIRMIQSQLSALGFRVHEGPRHRPRDLGDFQHLGIRIAVGGLLQPDVGVPARRLLRHSRRRRGGRTRANAGRQNHGE